MENVYIINSRLLQPVYVDEMSSIRIYPIYVVDVYFKIIA